MMGSDCIHGDGLQEVYQRREDIIHAAMIRAAFVAKRAADHPEHTTEMACAPAHKARCEFCAEPVRPCECADTCALRSDAERYDYLRRVNGWDRTDDLEIDAAMRGDA